MLSRHRRFTRSCMRRQGARAGDSPSAKAQNRQKAAARGRKVQREQDLAVRRIAVSYCFKRLPPRLKQKPQSGGTAQAIMRKIDELKLSRMPPMTERTIKEDIRFLKDNGNFGI